VEVLDDPSLAGKPVIVGGSGARGVVAACTYEARMYGVHSAIPSSVAKRLCPTAIFLDGRYHRYTEVSRQLNDIFESVTPLVEGISLDEAFLDVTGARQLLGDGPAIAWTIRSRVRQELKLACSVGVGRNKLMAKLASKAAKPVATRSGVAPGPGVVVVPRHGELDFLHPLPVRALWGVGPVTGRRLESLGVTCIGDIAALPAGVLEHALGPAAGAHLDALARGHDPRPVVAEQPAKSIGHEETFASDLWDPAELHRHLTRMVDASATGLRRSGLAARTVSVKLRFADFTMVTRSHSMGSPIDTTAAIGAVAAALLESVDLHQGVRLLGVSLAGLGDPGSGLQLSLDLGPTATGPSGERPARAGDEAEDIQQSWGAVTRAVDAIRARYGGASVGPASLVGPRGLRVRNRGEAQWGPRARPEPEVGEGRTGTL
ncbi:MAG: DNA polymerase IV, partial [Acidimicrobiales bacterium]